MCTPATSQRPASFAAARERLRAAVAEFREAAAGDALGWAVDSDIADSLIDLVAIKRTIEAVSADVAARVSGGNTFAEVGFRNGPAWLRSRTNESYSSAQRMFEQGEWMSRVPVMAGAWRDGAVSLRHVRALVEAHAKFWRLSSGLAELEPVLVDMATRLEPRVFERTLMGKLYEIDAAVVDEVQSKRRRHDVGLHVSTTLDGFVRVDGLLSPEMGQQLINAIAAAADKARRDKNSAAADKQAAPAQVIEPGSCPNTGCVHSVSPCGTSPCSRCRALLADATRAHAWPGYVCSSFLCPNNGRPVEEFAAAPLDPESCSACIRAAAGENPDVPHEPHIPMSQRNLEALQILLDSAASAMGDDKLPDIGGARPVVQITIPSESLIADGSAAPGWITSLTGTQVTPVSASTARRLACDSVRQLLLLDSNGHLDAISRLERVIPIPMRKAITIRDAGCCRFPGCKAAIREIHHIVYWQHGGKTTTDNLVGLCSFHHHQIHDKGWTLTGDPNARLTFTDPLKRGWHSDPPRHDPPRLAPPRRQ